MIRRASLFVVSVCLVLSLCGVARANVIVFDTFESPGATVGDDANDPLDLAWTGHNASNLSIVTGQIPPSGNHNVYNQGGSSYRWMEGHLPPVPTLDMAGEELILSFDFKCNNAPALPGTKTNDGYRFGLFDAGDQGYFIDIAVIDQDVANPPAGLLTWEKDDGANSLLMGNDGGNTILATLTTNPPIINTNAVHHIVMSFLRTTGGMHLTADFDNGAAILSVVDTSSPLTGFDRIVSGTGAHGIDYHKDNIQLQYIPEPCTLSLLALGGIGLLARRRKR